MHLQPTTNHGDGSFTEKDTHLLICNYYYAQVLKSPPQDEWKGQNRFVVLV